MQQITNTNQINNPIARNNIYRVSMTCNKSVNNIWTYRAKIFYRKGQTKAIHEITASNMDSLIVSLRHEMRTLIVQ